MLYANPRKCLFDVPRRQSPDSRLQSPERSLLIICRLGVFAGWGDMGEFGFALCLLCLIASVYEQPLRFEQDLT